MIVRVFRWTGEPGEEFSGQDYEFETLPQPGQMLRFTDPGGTDETVDEVGFIQDGQRFVASVWMKRPPTYQAMIA